MRTTNPIPPLERLRAIAAILENASAFGSSPAAGELLIDLGGMIGEQCDAIAEIIRRHEDATAIVNANREIREATGEKMAKQIKLKIGEFPGDTRIVAEWLLEANFPGDLSPDSLRTLSRRLRAAGYESGEDWIRTMFHALSDRKEP